MLYRPKYCSNCGEKIERAEWNLWTSRRFCDVCAIEQKQHELLPRVFAGAAILLGLFGVSAFFMPERSDERPVRFRQQASSALPGAAPRRAEQVADAASTSPANTSPATPNVPVTPDRPQASAAGAAYFCGALTKKGTPCSRRVKTPGRCWQHEGKPAMSTTDGNGAR